MTEDRLALVRRLVILMALYAIAGIVQLKPVTDNDIWWHLRTGEWVVKHGGVPATDEFSRYGHGHPWVAYSWLFEVLVYGMYTALGLTGLLLLRLGIVAVVLVALHRFVLVREPRFVRATLLTGLAFFALVPLLNERPWLFTILFTAVTLAAVLRLREGTATWTVWLLPLAFVLWANLHIQFVYGLAILGLACLAPLGDRWLGRPVSGREADTAGTRAWRHLVGLSAACAVATLVNPYGPRLYVVIFEYATQTVPFGVVHELMSPPFRLPFEWVFLGLAGAGAIALGRRGRFSLFDLLLMAGAAFASFRARRDMWFLVVASLAQLTQGGRLAAEPRPFTITLPRAAIIAAGVSLFLILMGRQRGLSEANLAEAVARQYPVQAVEHVLQARYPGPLFNDFDWGGYLIWALREYPVSMDGRTNLHGNERIERHVDELTHGSSRYEDDPDLMTARLVILERDSALASILRLHPCFECRYEDSDRPDEPGARPAIVFTARECAAVKTPPEPPDAQ